MVSCANEKLASGTRFMVGDAENIPFPDNTFDAVLSESVTAFTDKGKSLPEYFRVLKSGGYLGLNEITWLVQPADEIVGRRSRAVCLGVAARTTDAQVVKKRLMLYAANRTGGNLRFSFMQ